MKPIKPPLLLTAFVCCFNIQIVLAQVGWYRQVVPGADTNAFSNVCFSNDMVGIAVGGPNTILYTVDGGNSWDSTSTDIPEDILLTSVCHIVGHKWVAVGDRVILISENDGVTWLPHLLDYRTQLHCVQFLDSLKGFACGLNGVVATTINGGIDWIIDTLNADYDMHTVEFYDANRGMIVGQDGLILRTTDGGSTWQQLPTSFDNYIDDIDFLDSSTAVLCAWGGLVMKTTDFGEQWDTLSLDTRTYLHSITFPTSNIGYVVGYGGFIATTSDAGISWLVQESGTSKALHSVFAVDTANIYSVGDQAIILHTKTGGVVSVDGSLLSSNQNNSLDQLYISFDSNCNVQYAYSNRSYSRHLKLLFYDLNANLLRTTNLDIDSGFLSKSEAIATSFSSYCTVLGVFNAGKGVYHILID